MAPFFSDAFTDTDEVTLQDHTPDVGTSWTRLYGPNAADNFEIISNRAQPTGAGGNRGLAYTADATYPSADYDVTLTLVTLLTNTTSPFYMLVRVADIDNMYAVYIQSGTGTCSLYKKVAGTWTALGDAFDSPADGSVCKLEIIGDALKFYDDGVEVASATDSDLSAAGEAGIAVGGNTELVTSTDDIRVHVIDAWELNDLAGGGDTELDVADSAHAHAADAPALVQAHLLAVADSAHAHGAENVALTQAYLLAVADSAHAHAAEAPALIQQHVLAVADATHSHTAEAPALVQQYTITVADALHAHAADNVTLSIEGDVQLVVADASHAHSADAPALLQAYVLAVADATHSHTAEAPALLQAYSLAVQDAGHAHSADTLAVVQAHVLAVADALHAHTADQVNFGPAVLIVSMAFALQQRTVSFGLAQRTVDFDWAARSVAFALNE